MDPNPDDNRPMKLDADEKAMQIDNKSKPVDIMGKVSGSAKVGNIDFAAMMRASKKHGGQNKSNNFKEAKKANLRRNDKYDREAQKLYDAQVQAKLEEERVKWAPVDKDDAKFQMKMAEKMTDKGPTTRAQNKALQEEEEKMMEESTKKVQKNGWGKKK